MYIDHYAVVTKASIVRLYQYLCTLYLHFRTTVARSSRDSTVYFKYLCVCFLPIHSGTPSALDVPVGVTQEEGHTEFLIHLLSAVRALIFHARRIQPFLFPCMTVKSNFVY